MHLLYFLVSGIVSAFLFSGCSGASGTAGSPCHSSSECASGLTCVGPNDAQRCGIAPRRLCGANADCQPNLVCNAIADSCSPNGVGAECGSKCGTCSPGFRCNAAGACEPVPCDQGYQCPSYQRCDPAAAHAKGRVYEVTQGCVNIPCTADANCAAAKACVNGFCQDGPGNCQELLPVP